MARIRVTAYECERDLLPTICARCGRPATGRVSRPARYLADDRKFWQPFSVIFGFVFFPPLGVLAVVGFGQKVNVPLPMCENHLRDYEWRDRASLRWVLPIWSAVVLFFEVCCVIDVCYYGDGALMLLGVLAAAGPAVFADTIINRTSVKLSAHLKGVGVWLNGVHPDFVAALTEDRARSRIDDPERRTNDDIKNDYDDELN